MVEISKFRLILRICEMNDFSSSSVALSPTFGLFTSSQHRVYDDLLKVPSERCIPVVVPKDGVDHISHRFCDMDTQKSQFNYPRVE
jgi:hypothetical protein